jgi:rhodanese-related sulfurtransferase
MAISVTRDEVRGLLLEGAVQVVEVLPAGEYRWRHIAGAINLPLTELTEEAAGALDRGRPVVVYCNDLQ